MSNTDLIPNEPTTEFLAAQEIKQNAAVQSFLEGLDSEQQRRFSELAHHLVHIGFEDGLRRPAPLSDQQREVLAARQMELYAKGAGDALDPPPRTGN